MRIQRLAHLVDILVVSVHAGKEGEAALNVSPGPEYCFNEHRGDVTAFAHGAIERGADLVLMHGPHVPRGMEIYRGRLVAYSLGNFCTYGHIAVGGNRGITPLLWVELDRAGTLRRHTVYSFKQSPPGGPRRDPEDRALRLIRELSLQDFDQTVPAENCVDSPAASRVKWSVQLTRD